MPRRRLEAEQVGEADGAVHARHRAERRRQVHVMKRERPGRGDIASAAPGDPPLAGQPAIDQGDDPLRQRRQLFGLQIGAEADPGHVEQSVAGAGLQIMGDGDVGDPRTARRMVERAGRGDPAVGQPEIDIVAAQRVEFGRLGSVGQEQAAIERHRALLHPPAPGRLAQPQRHAANDRAAVAERAVARIIALQPPRFEDYRSLRPADPHCEVRHVESFAQQPRRGGGQADGRPAERAGEARPAQQGADLQLAAAPLVGDGGADRAKRQARAAQAQAAHLEAGEARIEAAPAEAEAGRPAEAGVDRQAQATNEAARHRPVEQRHRRDIGRAVARRGEAHRRQRQSRAPDLVRRDSRLAAQRGAIARLAQRQLRARQAAPRHCQIGIDPHPARRPVIIDSVPTGGTDPRSAWPLDVGGSDPDSAAAREIDQHQFARRVEIARRPADRRRNGFGDRLDRRAVGGVERIGQLRQDRSAEPGTMGLVAGDDVQAASLRLQPVGAVEPSAVGVNVGQPRALRRQVELAAHVRWPSVEADVGHQVRHAVVAGAEAGDGKAALALELFEGFLEIAVDFQPRRNHRHPACRAVERIGRHRSLYLRPPGNDANGDVAP